jgi:hypothetical protein
LANPNYWSIFQDWLLSSIINKTKHALLVLLVSF